MLCKLAAQSICEHQNQRITKLLNENDDGSHSSAHSLLNSRDLADQLYIWTSEPGVKTIGKETDM